LVTGYGAQANDHFHTNIPTMIREFERLAKNLKQ
jgi:hypothetical protein